MLRTFLAEDSIGGKELPDRFDDGFFSGGIRFGHQVVIGPLFGNMDMPQKQPQQLSRFSRRAFGDLQFVYHFLSIG